MGNRIRRTERGAQPASCTLAEVDVHRRTSGFGFSNLKRRAAGDVEAPFAQDARLCINRRRSHANLSTAQLYGAFALRQDHSYPVALET